MTSGATIGNTDTAADDPVAPFLGLHCCDNLPLLSGMPDACIDLVYIDPPFNTGRHWGDFDDLFSSTSAYIDFMRPRCEELRRVLKLTGSFYYHCDPTASHYVKVMLDGVFGDGNFRSEVIWNRTSSHGNVGKSFGNICDSIFYYTGSDEYTWNQLFVPYSKKHVETKFTGVDSDGRRFTTSDLRNPSYRPNLIYDYKGYKPHPNGWAISREKMEQYDREGRLYFPPDKEGRIRLKRYLDETSGERLQNLWDDIPPINSRAAERLGYPTQKPLPLLERIVKVSSNPGDVVLDSYCGSGTALIAAKNLGRRWVGIDVSAEAIGIARRRLDATTEAVAQPARRRTASRPPKGGEGNRRQRQSAGPQQALLPMFGES